MHTRIKALLIAEAANPEWASVPLVGWSMATAIARHADAHIVTQIRNREAFLRAGLQEGIDFTCIDTEPLSRPLWKLAKFLRGGKGLAWTIQTAITSLSYPYFERLVWRQFGARIEAGEFDVVHRITPLTPTAPSSLARKVRRAGSQFILGPLNGGVPWPKDFDKERRREREWLSYVRGVYKWMPGYRATIRYASRVFCGSRFTLSELPRKYIGKYVYEPENGIDVTRFTERCGPRAGGPLKLCFVGRLVPYKGADMVMRAAQQLLRDGLATLEIVGDGPMMGELVALAAELALGDSVRLHGWVRHENVEGLLASCHVLAFPSIREFGGGVVLEAMAVGLVPVVVDYAGPGELVDDEVGFKVPMGDREQIVAHLAIVLKSLTLQPASELAAKADACVKRIAQRFTWDAKAERMLAHYRELVAAR